MKETCLMSSTDKHYHPMVANRLRDFVTRRDWQGITSYLQTLSHAQYRTAGYMLGEMFMPELSDHDFWSLSQELVSSNSKAFLVTLLKSASKRRLDIESDSFISFCDSLRNNEIDRQKVLVHLLPLMNTPEEVLRLFDMMSVPDREKRIPYLLRMSTLPTSYVLFHTLKYVEHDRSLLIRTVYFLMKRGDDKSFNFASLLKSYFGLDEVKGTFSLRIEPYQLARLEGSYEAFCQALSM